jgi:hypothetical protein
MAKPEARFLYPWFGILACLSIKCKHFCPLPVASQIITSKNGSGFGSDASKNRTGFGSDTSKMRVHFGIEQYQKLA